MKAESLTYADLDRPWFYVCYECIPDYTKDEPEPFKYAMDKAQEQLNVSLSQKSMLEIFERLKDK